MLGKRISGKGSPARLCVVASLVDLPESLFQSRGVFVKLYRDRVLVVEFYFESALWTFDLFCLA